MVTENNKIAPIFKRVKRIKDETFNIDELDYYSLCLQVGIYDFQICVVDSRNNKCMGLEDYRFGKIRTLSDRLKIIRDILNNHEYVVAGFWKNIKLLIKSHKFTIVPTSFFTSSAASDYLSVNSEIKTEFEDVNYYKQIGTDSVLVFACDKKLVEWLQKVYKNKQIHVIHQGSALIEGALKDQSSESDEKVFCFIDRGVMHITCFSDKKLVFYNQFATKKTDDNMKYLSLVMKELKFSIADTPVILEGFVNPSADSIKLMKKYVKNLSYKDKPAFLKYSYQFDEIQDYQYTDILSGYLCD